MNPLTVCKGGQPGRYWQVLQHKRHFTLVPERRKPKQGT